MMPHARARLVHAAIAGTLAILLPIATLVAQDGGGSGTPAVSAPRITAVAGRAWHADDTPVRSGKLRLRSVLTGRIAASATSDQAGQFTFTDIPVGTYIVELLSGSGKIAAISDVVAAVGGESVTTFVRETTRTSSFRDLFMSAAAAVSAAAASTGITALSPQAVRPASPQK